jgi:hypothetical protein
MVVGAEEDLTVEAVVASTAAALMPAGSLAGMRGDRAAKGTEGAKAAVMKDAVAPAECAMVQPPGLLRTRGMPTAIPVLATRHPAFIPLGQAIAPMANQPKAQELVDLVVKDRARARLKVTRPMEHFTLSVAASTPQLQLKVCIPHPSLRQAMQPSSLALAAGMEDMAVGMPGTVGMLALAGAADIGVPVSAGAVAAGVGVDGAGAVGVGDSAGDGVGATARSGVGRRIGIARGGTTMTTLLLTTTPTTIPITFTRIRKDSVS